MAFNDWASPTIKSTGFGVSTDPSSAALLAEIDSTQFAAISSRVAIPYQVHWIVAATASTNATFLLQHALSTGLDSTGVRDEIVVMTSSGGNSAEFVGKYVIEPGDRLRVHLLSTLTGTVAAKILAEALT
jgi:hypothetical protein